MSGSSASISTRSLETRCIICWFATIRGRLSALTTYERFSTWLSERTRVVKTLIVFAHPEPQSFCGAMRDTAIETLRAAGHEVRSSDLYAMHFDPVGDRRD